MSRRREASRRPLGVLAAVALWACGPAALPPPPATTSTPVLSTQRAATASPAASPTASARPSPTVAPPVSPGASPAAACPRLVGGSSANAAQLTAIRIGHQPGFDRLVFEFGPSQAPGGAGMPAYVVEPASSLSGASGQPVTIAGSALFGVRFQGSSTRNVDGTPSYSGGSDLKPTTPLVKETRLVEDFERVLVWGVGLDHLVCPTPLELSAPVRLVLDFATPP